MPDSPFIYRIRGEDSLSHAYKSPYTSSSRAGYNPVKRHERYEKTKEIIGRKAKTYNKYGNYKSPYYDPVARHERYLRERSSLGIGQGLSSTKSKSSGRGGSSGKSGKGGSGKGSSSQTAENLAEQVKALRDESNLNTEAQREAAKRKLEDLRENLTKQVQKLREDAHTKLDTETNETAILGITQNLKSQIENLQNQTSSDMEKISANLKDWISNERDALEKRIAALYKSHGKTYTVTTQADKQRASESRDKEVSSRADSIYKKKS